MFAAGSGTWLHTPEIFPVQARELHTPDMLTFCRGFCNAGFMSDMCVSVMYLFDPRVVEDFGPLRVG